MCAHRTQNLDTTTSDQPTTQHYYICVALISISFAIAVYQSEWCAVCLALGLARFVAFCHLLLERRKYYYYYIFRMFSYKQFEGNVCTCGCRLLSNEQILFSNKFLCHSSVNRRMHFRFCGASTILSPHTSIQYAI